MNTKFSYAIGDVVRFEDSINCSVITDAEINNHGDMVYMVDGCMWIAHNSLSFVHDATPQSLKEARDAMHDYYARLLGN